MGAASGKATSLILKMEWKSCVLYVATRLVATIMDSSHARAAKASSNALFKIKRSILAWLIGAASSTRHKGNDAHTADSKNVWTSE